MRLSVPATAIVLPAEPAPLLLTRLTTVFDETEDRLRLTGEVEGDAPVVIWLTQRLLIRIVPVLLNGLTQQQGAHALQADVLHSFAQHAARAELTQQAPVPATSTRAAWLADSVALSLADHAVRLTFLCPDAEHAASVVLPIQALRQWLGIVYDQCCRAEWPLTLWPAWLTDSAHTDRPASALLH